MQRVEFTAEGQATRLIALLPAPTAVSPSDRADGVSDLHEVTLTFAGPVDTAALARLLSIELRPAPGIDAAAGQFLGPQDFTVTPLERAKPGDKQTYLISLKSAVPDGRVLVLHLKLADEPGLDEPVYEARIKSAVPFRASDTTCGNGFGRDTVAGVLRCSPYSYVSTANSDEEGETTTHGPRRGLIVSFTAKPQALDAVSVRQALRITPPVDDLAAAVDGSRIKLTGRFLADKVYELRIEPGALADEHGRPLEGEAVAQRFAFAPEQPSIKWDAAQGLVERFGPQFVPMRGGGYDKADLRIHAIDPLSRDFWPFPGGGVETDDDAAPPLPGNEPAKWTDAGDAETAAIAARIKALGSPAVSELMPLPIRRGGPDAKFGLDLKPLFAKIAGADQPGTYLVGMRPIDGGKRRMAARASHRSLASRRRGGGPRALRRDFAAHGRAGAEAQIRLEGVRDDTFVTLAQGTTGVTAPSSGCRDARRGEDQARRRDEGSRHAGHRIRKARPRNIRRRIGPSPRMLGSPGRRVPDTTRRRCRACLCHVFTERPIYRPEEAGAHQGLCAQLSRRAPLLCQRRRHVVVTGPNNQEWRVPVKLDAMGGFYHKFDATTPATGDYLVKFEPDGASAGQAGGSGAPEPQDDCQPDDQEEPPGRTRMAAPRCRERRRAKAARREEKLRRRRCTSCGDFPFKKEAYRLPTFEVLLNGPQQVPLDGEFSVDLLSRYFAGGLVADRPIKWRASQFPYAWTPPGREGFVLLERRAFLERRQVQVDARCSSATARPMRGGSARITFDTDDRADRAAAPLHRRGDGHRRGRHPGPQRRST